MRQGKLVRFARVKLGRLRRAARVGLKDLRDPEWVPDGHFYSPIASPADTDRSLATEPSTDVRDIDLNLEAQLALVDQLDLRRPDENRWIEDNQMFSATDAGLLRAMLLHLRPKRVVEVGSGFSTALMLDVADTEMPELEIVCIEPYADRLRSRLRPTDVDRLRLIESKVEELPIDDIIDLLSPGDLLFIDSTHVVKVGSDVCYLYFEILPRLPVGTIVQIHDMFWPFEYPAEWRQERRGWAELYLLRAFLMNNDAWEVLLFGSQVWTDHGEHVPEELRPNWPGSLYLRRKA